MFVFLVLRGGLADRRKNKKEVRSGTPRRDRIGPGFVCNYKKGNFGTWPFKFFLPYLKK